MISSTFGAPLGGTTLGGQYGVESGALRPILPPNGCGGGGRYFPSIVVVALGEPGTPLICWACAGATARAIRAMVESTIARALVIAGLLRLPGFRLAWA